MPTPRAMFRILSVTCLLTRKALRLIGERSEPHTYRTVGKNIRHIYIYICFLYIIIYIYIYDRPCVVHVPLTRYAQTSDWPVEVQRSI